MIKIFVFLLDAIIGGQFEGGENEIIFAQSLYRLQNKFLSTILSQTVRTLIQYNRFIHKIKTIVYS